MAENLKFYRIAAELSQAELARKLGVSRQAVTNWETGKSVPSSEFLYKLCELYGIEFSKLVGQGGIAHVAAATDEKDEEIYVPTASDWAKVHAISEFIDKLADDYRKRKACRNMILMTSAITLAIIAMFILVLVIICIYPNMLSIDNGIIMSTYQVGVSSFNDVLLLFGLMCAAIMIGAIAANAVQKYIATKERTNEIKE